MGRTLPGQGIDCVLGGAQTVLGGYVKWPRLSLLIPTNIEDGERPSAGWWVEAWGEEGASSEVGEGWLGGR